MNFPYTRLYKLNVRIILAFFLWASSAAALEIEGIKLPEGTSVALTVFSVNSDTYIKSSSLARFLGGKESTDFQAKTGNIDFGDYDLHYSLYSTYIKSGENIYNIYKPVLFDDGSFLLPIRYTVDVINKVSPISLDWDGHKLVQSPPKYNVAGISASQKLNGLLIEIDLKDRLRFDVVKTDENWLVVTISGGKVDSMAFVKRLSVPAIYEVKTYQFEQSAQISIRIRPKELTFTSKLKENPYRIQILIRGKSFADSTLASGHISQEDFSNNRIDVIVIDPGHGGEDMGAIGPDNTFEKDIVLSISKFLFELLQKDKRFEPVMTRQEDIFIPLSERTSLANSVGGDIFVSIHANASRNIKARGLITFFLADARSDQARATATLENSSIRFEKIESQNRYQADLDFTLRDMVQTEFQRESADLADMIQKNMKESSEIESRGVDQAGFYVLDKAYMPAVLVETAFISNRFDEKLLRDKDFQKKWARAIYDSIVAFKEKYELDKRASE